MKKYFVLLIMICIPLFTFGQDLADLYDKVKPSVVVIKVTESVSAGVGNPNQMMSSGGLGSGVLVSNDGLIITAAHVVGIADRIEVEFSDGQVFGAKVISLSKPADLALIKLNIMPQNPVVAKLGDSDKVRIGQQIFVIGAPEGLEHSLSSGYISGRHTQNRMTSDMKMAEFLQTDAAINPGNSGGPVFNLDGEVVGIASFILSQSGGFEGIGFMATSNMAKQELMNEKNSWQGVETMEIEGEMARVFNIPQKSGVLCLDVAKNSPAYYAGLRGGFIKMSIGETEFLAGGDIMLSVDGLEFTGQESLEKIRDHINGLTKGTVYKVKILRGGVVMELDWIMP
jgi:serine protease Do